VDAPAPHPRWRLSPINRRRLQVFRRHRRGFWSLCLFAAIFAVSLCAELIANDRPILISYKGEWLSPLLHDYGEDRFGGFLFAPADYRNKAVASEITAHGWMVWPPIRFSYGTPNYEAATPAPTPPTWALTKAQCAAAAAKVTTKIVSGAGAPASLGCAAIEPDWLGTDGGARDVLARIIYGTRVSILFGVALTVLSSVVGVAAGAVQGYFGGRLDLIFQRVIEIWSALPSLYVLIIIASFITPSLLSLLFVLLLFNWVQLVGVVRAEFLRARNFEYVRAARALGLTDAQIIWRHLLPNATVATLTLLPFIMSASVTALTALDFLGLGQPPGAASLGELLQEGQSHREAWWLAVSGFASTGVLLVLLVFIGEGVRDAFDPRRTLA
jgi:microcin C transport system permease protein